MSMPEMDVIFAECQDPRCLPMSMERECATPDQSPVLFALRHSHSGVITRLTRSVTRN